MRVWVWQVYRLDFILLCTFPLSQWYRSSSVLRLLGQLGTCTRFPLRLKKATKSYTSSLPSSPHQVKTNNAFLRYSANVI